MFEGTYLWDAKHGVPANIEDPESVGAFINELRDKPQETNANLLNTHVITNI